MYRAAGTSAGAMVPARQQRIRIDDEVRAGCPLRWTGSGAGETGVDKRSGAARVHVDARYFRPAEVDVLLGDASKARRELGWTPKVTFEALVDMMVDADLEKARKEGAAVPSV